MPEKWVKLEKTKDGFTYKKVIDSLELTVTNTEKIYFSPFIMKRGCYNDDC